MAVFIGVRRGDNCGKEPRAVVYFGMNGGDTQKTSTLAIFPALSATVRYLRPDVERDFG
jgi:hypothetical protein